jgi:hypothetical protein
MAWFPECAATPEDEGANWSPATMGNFIAEGKASLRRLREADAYKQVAGEAKSFHEKKALKYGVHTGRGMAHLKASLGYAKEAAGRLQEMFAQGGDPSHLDELPPKAIIKANKSAMKFHQGQAQKAGLDSDIGHAHIAAMEHHGDILQKAKKLHQQTKQQQPQRQPMMASSEGGPGSGPRAASGLGKPFDKHMSKHESLVRAHGKALDKLNSLRDKYPNSHPAVQRAEQSRNKIVSAIKENLRSHQKEASPGHSSKQSPVPVPKKSEQPNNDIRQNKPPIGLNPQDANKPGGMRQLQQNEAAEGGPGSGRHPHESRESRIRNFEADAMDDVRMGMGRTLPKKAKKQMGDDLIFRAHRTKREARRYLR